MLFFPKPNLILHKLVWGGREGGWGFNRNMAIKNSKQTNQTKTKKINWNKHKTIQQTLSSYYWWLKTLHFFEGLKIESSLLTCVGIKEWIFLIILVVDGVSCGWRLRFHFSTFFNFFNRFTFVLLVETLMPLVFFFLTFCHLKTCTKKEVSQISFV